MSLHHDWLQLLDQMRSISEELLLQIPVIKRSHDQQNIKSFRLVTDLAENHTQSRRFIVHILAIKLLIKNKLDDRVASVRELFYKDVSSFQNKQSVLSRALHNVSLIHEESLSEDYKVLPSPKGYLYGGPGIEFIQKSSQKMILTYSSKIQLIPHFSNCISIRSKPSAIVIFEKDSVFQSYCDHYRKVAFASRFSCMFMTAKGFPDQASTRFLKNVSTLCEDAPIIAFMDSDVYGVNIFLSFKKSLGREGARMSFGGVFLLDYRKGWVTISRRDILLIISTLRRVSSATHQGTVQHKRFEACTFRRLKQELTRGLLIFKKAEMNTIGTANAEDHTLFSYVDAKLKALQGGVIMS